MSQPNSMRDLIVDRLKNSAWMDYCYKRGDQNAANMTYVDWLRSLDDDDLLSAYNRVRDYEADLD
jgi:hypothetical protein